MDLYVFFLRWIFLDPKTKKIPHDFLWLAGFLTWKVVGGVVGAASGQVGSEPVFCGQGWGCGFLLPEKWTMFF